MAQEAVWAQNHILLAEVESTTDVPVLRGNTFARTAHVTVRIIQRFTPDEPAFQVQDGPRVTFADESFVFPTFRAYDQPTVAVGDAIIIIAPKTRRQVTYFFQPGTGELYTGIVDALHRLSLLRLPRATQEDLGNAALEGHPLLARYAIKRLLVADGAPPGDDFVRRLRAALDAPDTDTHVALLASRLLSRLTGKPSLNRDEYVWLKTRVLAPTTWRRTALLPFIWRILEYSDERAETIELFVRIGLDAEFPDDTRVACMNALTEPPMFSYNTPEIHSHTIVRAVLQLLEHDTMTIRQGMTGALWGIGFRASHLPDVKPELRALLEEIATGLRRAVARESVAGLRIFMAHTLAWITRASDMPTDGEHDR